MESLKNKISAIKPKSIYQWSVAMIEHHSLTVLIIVAGILVGFSLYSVSSLTQNASQTTTTSDSPTPSSSLDIKPETEQILQALSQDQDVSISSNIATYRRSAFSDATEESLWVIDAAAVLESYFNDNEFYPTQNQIASVLVAANVAASDDDGRGINSDSSNYRYTTESCENGRCLGFFLSADVGDSIYQLGETDSTKREWVNSTAQALDTYRKSSTLGLYPTEENFISEMSSFYVDTLSETFVATDPTDSDVNKDGSDYSYKGIDCTVNGCGSFVLRTTFKDGAFYFQQSR